MGAARIVLRQTEDPKSFLLGASFERTAVRARDHLLVAAARQPARQEQDLLLPAAQSGARVNMKDSH